MTRFHTNKYLKNIQQTILALWNICEGVPDDPRNSLRLVTGRLDQTTPPYCQYHFPTAGRVFRKLNLSPLALNQA